MSAESHPSPASVRRAGRYEYISQIATSPLGPLWAAHVTTGEEEGRIVAVRRIEKTGPLGERGDEMTHAARAAIEVRHPRVAAVLDVVVAETEIAVVMEYVEGELLRSIQRRAGLKNQPFSDRIALRLGLDLCDALSTVTPGWRHVTESDGRGSGETLTATAVHGGLAADSVLIATFGEPIVLDLGTSSTARRHALVANHPDVLPYCAPEQVLGSRADERSDVFTIGVLLWEMLANRSLFGSTTWTRFTPSDDEPVPARSVRAAVVRRKVLEATIARLDALVRVGGRIPTPVANIVARALEREPSARYASVADLGEALRELGSEWLAESSEVSDFVHALAGTSIEARGAALSAITRSSDGSSSGVDSARPTLAPRAVLPTDGTAARFPDPSVPPNFDPRNAQAFDSAERKKPPLPTPRKRRK